MDWSLMIAGALLLGCYGTVHWLRLERTKKIDRLLEPQPPSNRSEPQIRDVTRDQVQNFCAEDRPLESETAPCAGDIAYQTK